MIWQGGGVLLRILDGMICAAQILTLFQTKNVIFHTRFQNLASKKLCHHC